MEKIKVSVMEATTIEDIVRKLLLWQHLIKFAEAKLAFDYFQF